MIVLLSLFSIFLCGTVVTYVGTTSNYKVLFDEQKGINKSLKSENTSLKRKYNEKVTLMKELEKKLNDRIQRLEDESSKLSVDLRKAERMSLEYQGRANSWAGIITSFEQTIGNLEQSLKLTQEQLNKARSEGIKDRKELNQLTASFYEKMVQLESLEASKRQLLEQKSSLEKRMNNLMGPDVNRSAIAPVTQDIDSVRLAAIPSGVNLRGLIAEVGQSLVTISLGSADGVQKGIVFHVTRGDDFICDIIITDVDTNKSAGVLDLVQQAPRVMDNVSTRL
jgi:hypothetical protein